MANNEHSITNKDMYARKYLFANFTASHEENIEL